MTPTSRSAAPSWYSRPGSRSWRSERPPDAPEMLHRSMPGYRHTPLVELTGLAVELGVGRVFVKDESTRLGLPAFKMLGASWAVFRAVSALAPAAEPRQTLDDLRVARPRLGSITLVSATDGNHGRAVARMARMLGTSARVFVPNVVSAAATALIESEGAEVTVLEEPYDETVRRAAKFAAEHPDAILVQDTAWPGYEEVPQWIVDGYSTLFREIDTQLAGLDAAPVGLMTVPVGVGSLAQAAVTFHRSSHNPPPALLGVEPDTAACVLTSLRHGRPVSVQTGHTRMAGLNCGTLSSIAWPHLVKGLDAAVCVSDDQSDDAAHDLARVGVHCGACGAASLAGLRATLSAADGAERRASLGLTPTSTVVLLSTDGAPD